MLDSVVVSNSFCIRQRAELFQCAIDFVQDNDALDRQKQLVADNQKFKKAATLNTQPCNTRCIAFLRFVRIVNGSAFGMDSLLGVVAFICVPFKSAKYGCSTKIAMRGRLAVVLNFVFHVALRRTIIE